MDVREYLEDKGFQVVLSGDNWTVDCPFCDDRRKRLGIHKASGKWNCFNCGERGKSIMSLQKKLDGTPAQELKLPQGEDAPKPVEIDQGLAAKYIKLLKKEGRLALGYLQEVRGFSLETIKHFQLGSWKKKGYEYVSIPFWKRGKLVNIKFRAVNYQDKKYKWRRTTGGESSLFHDDVVDLDFDHIYVTEAELDCVALWNAGIKNVIAVTTGAKSFKQEWYDRLSKFKKIYLVYDSDVDGQSGAEKAASRLGFDRCINVRLPAIPGLEKTDANNYFWDEKNKKPRYTLKDFKQLVKDARKFEVRDTISLRDAFKEVYKDHFLADEDELIGLRTPWKKVNSLIGGFKPGHLVVVSGGPKIGKCVKHDMLVVNPETGERITIKKAIEDRLPVISSYNEKTGKIQAAKISDWYDSGVKPHVRVVTRLGDQVETTLAHPFLTFDGWKKASELHVGDKIAVPRALPVFGQERWSFGRAFVLGSLLADGNLHGTSITWTKTDPELIRLMDKSLQTEFGAKLVQKAQDPITYRIVSNTPGQNALTRWIKDLGIHDVGSREKLVPSVVFKLDRQSLTTFLSAVWSGDGSVTKVGIEYSSASQALIDDLRHLMLRLGIRMVKHQHETSCNGKLFTSWRIATSQIEMLEAFEASLSFFGSKGERFDDLMACVGTPKRDYLTSFPPQMWELIRSEAKARNLTMRGLATAVFGTKDFKFKVNGGCSRWMLRNINSHLNSKKLQHWLDSDVSFVEVVAIEDAGKHQCYDLTVPDTHTFIANDVVIHNTTWVLNLMRYMAQQEDVRSFLYECEMKPKRVAEKMIAMESPDFTTPDQITEIQIAHATLAIPGERIYFGYPQTDELTLDNVCERIKEAVQRYGIKFVCFDNLHFLVRGDNVRDRIGEVTRRFKLLAETLNIVFVLIVHPRKIGTREPTPDDLKDSSSIYQDLDTLVFLHRTPVEAKDNDKNEEETSKGGFEALCRVIVSGRWCEGGRTFLYFEGRRALFHEDGSLYNEEMQKFRAKNTRERDKKAQAKGRN